jgi:hypothetical protein
MTVGTDLNAESSRTVFLKKEIKIIEELVNVLCKPAKYEILEKGMFTVFNSSSSMLENIVNGPQIVGNDINKNKEVSTKMIDFQNLVALGQLLADKRNIIQTNDITDSSIDQSIAIIKIFYDTLSSHVYINHVITPASTAAVSAATASSEKSQHSWWNMVIPNKPIKTLDPKSSGTEKQLHAVKSTNPLESHDYFPDLRLVLKNVLVLFISFLKRYDELLNNIPILSKKEIELVKALRDLMLLLNVSILNKLVEIFKMLNPNLKLKTENDIYGVLSS